MAAAAATAQQQRENARAAPAALVDGAALVHIGAMPSLFRLVVPFALATMAAVGLYWLMGPGLGLSDHALIVGGLAGAGLIGVGYSLDSVMRRMK